MSFKCKKLVHVHFLKQVLLPCNACEVLLYTHDVAFVHSAVLRKRNFAILGEWLPGIPLFRGKNAWWSAVRRKDFVRCPESGSVRFSEVANVLQLWYFQSVTRQVSVVAWVSASRRVRYGRFHCSCFMHVVGQYKFNPRDEFSYRTVTEKTSRASPSSTSACLARRLIISISATPRRAVCASIEDTQSSMS